MTTEVEIVERLSNKILFPLDQSEAELLLEVLKWNGEDEIPYFEGLEPLIKRLTTKLAVLANFSGEVKDG